ncbi:flagellar assembly protein FliH [Paenibacillus sp. J2TS4]|uniref:flagellar assembly protein FliH n=1 Tax=Paenibacillus sp. J2TS4 TaxID=2807194 RepID=UPI001B0F18F3|nr:flagellar assembly protein FliH [Paenibacillus sp. J2TS4]GIP33066.1 type III secretion system protein [Paenibacillus sp. J2TS4]
MSKLIKPGGYISLDDTKVVNPLLHLDKLERAGAHPAGPLPYTEEEEQEIVQAKQLKEQILRDAEQLAEEQIRQAMEEAHQVKEQAKQELDSWWQEQRRLDLEERERSQAQGFQEGYDTGVQQAKEDISKQYENTMAEARTILEQAYETKRQIIRDAEPFLIELSCAIAEKIVQQQLTVSPEWVLAMTKEMLARKRERGTITLCVAPQSFAYLQGARDELKLVVDSQAELEIVPDSSVQDQGCVVRSEFGSIDARIETQLAEIKNALLEVAAAQEGALDEE